MHPFRPSRYLTVAYGEHKGHPEQCWARIRARCPARVVWRGTGVLSWHVRVLYCLVLGAPSCSGLGALWQESDWCGTATCMVCRVLIHIAAGFISCSSTSWYRVCIVQVYWAGFLWVSASSTCVCARIKQSLSAWCVMELSGHGLVPGVRQGVAEELICTRVQPVRRRAKVCCITARFLHTHNPRMCACILAHANTLNRVRCICATNTERFQNRNSTPLSRRATSCLLCTYSCMHTAPGV